MDTTTQKTHVNLSNVASMVPDNVKSMINIQSLQAFYLMAPEEAQDLFYKWLQESRPSK